MARLIAAMDDVDIHVLLAEDGPMVDELARAGATVEIMPLPKRVRTMRRDRVRVGTDLLVSVAVSGIYVVKVAHRLRRLRPDLVHTNTLKAALYGGCGARLAGLPCLWHIRDRIAPDYLPPTAVHLVRMLARVLPTYTVANSATTRATLGLPPHRISVMGSPVEIEERSEATGAGPVRRVGMIGRLAEWKGQHIFLRAFAEAFPEGPERAVIIGSALFGEDAYAQQLVDLTHQLGMADRVDFLGFRSDVGAELARLQLLVHASIIPEPFGQVVVQGMAAGVPVLAAQAGGPAEIITDQVDGLLYPPGDVHALALGLRRLAADEGLRARLAAQARETSKAYRPGVLGSRMQEIYEFVARR